MKSVNKPPGASRTYQRPELRALRMIDLTSMDSDKTGKPAAGKRRGLRTQSRSVDDIESERHPDDGHRMGPAKQPR